MHLLKHCFLEHKQVAFCVGLKAQCEFASPGEPLKQRFHDLHFGPGEGQKMSLQCQAHLETSLSGTQTSRNFDCQKGENDIARPDAP
jgi:hypothetical protein